MSLIHLASNATNSDLSIFTPDQVQPNAIDLRLDKVFGVANGSESYFRLSDDDKHHREKFQMEVDSKGYYRFDPGHSYEVTFEGVISIGADEAGWVITRSTLNRNGMFITSGLYDSGYSGAMAGALHNLTPDFSFIKKGTRIGQFLLFKAEALHAYNGSYGLNADGTPKLEEKRYHTGK